MSSPFEQRVLNALAAGNIFRALSPALLNHITCSSLPKTNVRGVPGFFGVDHFLFDWGQLWMGRGAGQASIPVVRARMPSSLPPRADVPPVPGTVDKASPAWQLLCELLDPAALRFVELILTPAVPMLSSQEQVQGEQEIGPMIQALAAYARKRLRPGEQRELFRALLSLLQSAPGMLADEATRLKSGRAMFCALAHWAWGFGVPLRSEMLKRVLVLPVGRAIDRVAMLILQFADRGREWKLMRCDFPVLFKLACKNAGQSEQGIGLVNALLRLLPQSAPGLGACLVQVARYLFHAPPGCRVQIAHALWDLPAAQNERLLLSLAQGLRARGEWLGVREAAAAQASDASRPKGLRRERRAQVALFHWLATKLIALYPPDRSWQSEEEHPDMHDPYSRRPQSSVLSVLAAQVGLLPLSDRDVALEVMMLMNLALASGWRPQQWNPEG